MSWTVELVAEMQVLGLFPNDTAQRGVKFHSNADPLKIAAVERLFAKGLVSEKDGGYLTTSGQEAARNLDAVLSVLRATE